MILTAIGIYVIVGFFVACVMVMVNPLGKAFDKSDVTPAFILLILLWPIIALVLLTRGVAKVLR